MVINIGLLLLAFSKSDKEHCRCLSLPDKIKKAPLVFLFVYVSSFFFFFYRPNTYHSNLQVSWDLNTGVCCTMGVGELTEVKGQTR